MSLIPKSFPPLFHVEQRFESPTCTDIQGEVTAQLSALRVADRIQKGDSVAITGGSRGIANIAAVVKAIANYFRGLSAAPFIVPAMGSHGGGTADGQRKVLESYGITETYCGCPIRSSMETVVIGEADEGFPIYFDRHAHAADHVVVCNRIKPHTNFAGSVQSGLMKMMMIGLGKKDGASLYHRAIHDHGFPRIIRSVAPQVVANANILCGVAIVEGGNHETAKLEAVLPMDFESRETELLELARDWMPKLPFRAIDVLVVDQIGKNISGTGMDTNVIARKHTETWDGAPDIKRIVVRGLTEQSHGNAAGIGFADFCLSRVVETMDHDATILNCLTALDVTGARIPVHYPSDKETIGSALSTLGLTPAAEARLVRIPDTGSLSSFWCSGAFLEEVTENPNLEQTSDLRPMSFNGQGMLD